MRKPARESSQSDQRICYSLSKMVLTDLKTCQISLRVRKQPIIALYLEFETVLKFYNLETWFSHDEANMDSYAR